MTRKHIDEIDRHVGIRIRQVRMLKGISQEKLAEELGLTFQQVQKYEKGVNRVGAGRLWKLAGIMGVPVTWFYEGLDQHVDGGGIPAMSAEAVKLAREFDALPENRRVDIARVLRALSATPGSVAA